MPLTSPYNYVPNPERYRVMTRVDPAHIAYIRKLYPMIVGIHDRILAVLFHRFITHLQNLEKENGTPLEPTWYAGSPGYVLLDLILERCNFDDIDALRAELQRSAAGRTVGAGSDDNVAGATVSIRPTVRRAAKQRTNTKGESRKRSDSRRSETGAEEKGQCGTGAGVPVDDERKA